MTRRARVAGFAFAATALGLVSGCCVYEVEPAAYAEPGIEAPSWQIEEAPIDTRSTFALRTDRGSTIVLRADGREVVGASVSLERFAEPEGNALRGRVQGQVVHLETGPGHVTGLLGTRPVDLTVAAHGDALRFDGVVGGEQSHFAMGSRAARGRVGRCSYELTRSGPGYEGRRSCGGPTAHVWMRIPTVLDQWQPEERAAVLAVLLAAR